MTGKAAGSGDIKGSDILKAFVDLIILVLLMVGSGFGGYWYGIHERLAPANSVAPGTPGALPATATTPPPAGATAAPATTTTTAPPATATTAPPATTANPGSKKEKFWITSSGTDYTGYQIIVNVNDNPVDNFFGPGKTIDITRFVKHGDNKITFEAKEMGNKYNKHQGDAAAVLELQIVKGPQVSEEFKPSDVLVTYKRNASENEDFNDSRAFSDGD
jgi:hypothetical protein